MALERHKRHIGSARDRAGPRRQEQRGPNRDYDGGLHMASLPAARRQTGTFSELRKANVEPNIGQWRCHPKARRIVRMEGLRKSE